MAVASRVRTPEAIEEISIVGCDSALDHIQRRDAKPNRADIVCSPSSFAGGDRHHRFR
jgi:hypothetical protein